MPSDYEIEENIKEIRERLGECAVRSGRKPEDIRLMAVTKTVPPERVNQAIACGIRLLGENRVQEFLDKRGQYDGRAGEIHFIGHLQTNKVKYIIDKVTMIESVDSVKLAEEIERRAKQAGKRMPVLLEVNIGEEESKSGFSVGGVQAAAEQIATFEHVALSGLMAIPPKEDSRRCFARMRELFEKMRAAAYGGEGFSTLSMGMSGDYEEAVLQGSNLIRLGTAIFGARTTR